MDYSAHLLVLYYYYKKYIENIEDNFETEEVEEKTVETSTNEEPIAEEISIEESTIEIEEKEVVTTISFNNKSIKNKGIRTYSLDERKQKLKAHMDKLYEADSILDELGIEEESYPSIDIKDINLVADTGIKELDKELNEQLKEASNRKYGRQFTLSEYARIIPKKNKK